VCQVAGVGHDDVEALRHEVLDLPQEAVQRLNALALGQVPVVA
jgi:hypothetical protein